MRIESDTEADAVYVRFIEEPVALTIELDELRVVDVAASGRIRGIELLNVSDGVTLEGLPVGRPELARKLREIGVVVRDNLEYSGAVKVDEQSTQARVGFASSHRLKITGGKWEAKTPGEAAESKVTAGVVSSRAVELFLS